MKLEQIENVYFVGIGGIGMSALARYFKNIGKNVAGYDKTETHLTAALISDGISIHFTDSIAEIAPEYKNPDNTLVVYTPACLGVFLYVKIFITLVVRKQLNFK